MELVWANFAKPKQQLEHNENWQQSWYKHRHQHVPSCVQVREGRCSEQKLKLAWKNRGCCVVPGRRVDWTSSSEGGVEVGSSRPRPARCCGNREENSGSLPFACFFCVKIVIDYLCDESFQARAHGQTEQSRRKRMGVVLGSSVASYQPS